MALIGKYTKYETVDTGETEIQTVEYPSDLPADHPDFDKAGTSEEVEVPVYETTAIVYENTYVTVQAINSWKLNVGELGDKNFFNITYRVYENEESRVGDLESYFVQDFIATQVIDYASNKSEIQQAYELVKTAQGCEELIND